jgi:hypothetical protein
MAANRDLPELRGNPLFVAELGLDGQKDRNQAYLRLE